MPQIATPRPYDPLDYENLAQNVVRALMDRPCVALPPAQFEGVGVYAIYYTGELACYKRVKGENSPIYVGCLLWPLVNAKGEMRLPPAAAVFTAGSREHAQSIKLAENLDLKDFSCRYLVVVPVWIELAERFLIEHYRPLWNTTIDGFGNHDPGAGRKDMKRPRWDVLHPGRAWAKKLKPAETSEAIIASLPS